MVYTDLARSPRRKVAPARRRLARTFLVLTSALVCLFVGSEHLLLGLIRLGQGVAGNVLNKLGLGLEAVRVEVKKQSGIGPDQRVTGNIPYAPSVKKVLALAVREARSLNHTYVGTEHILLGLLREGDGVAARVFKNFGVDMEKIRHEILKELDPNFGK